MQLPKVSPAAESALHRVLRWLKYLIPFAVSAGMIVWLFRKVDFHEVMDTIRRGCDFRYIALMMFITMCSHIIRGIRWGIQLRSVGLPRVPVVVESISIFGAYALNLVFPWLGEGWRCVYMSKREKAPLSTVIGTDLGDRSSDALTIIVLSLLTWAVASAPLDRFFSHYAIGRDLEHYVGSPWLWVTILGVLALFDFLNRHYHNSAVVKSIDGTLDNMWNGFKVLFHLNRPWMYLILTFGIWGCYFLETYVCLYAFPFTRELITTPGSFYGLVPGLVIFMFGSYSMAVPSNGGLGPWNLAVMFALSLYGISNVDGAAFSIVMWSFQAMMLVALGIFSAIYISLHKK
ncbi:MAG: flippase-like domain-containing protein [Duncaniella sp.]|nr:flippase-like domain-containing protein [Duncaniella sp.]